MKACVIVFPASNCDRDMKVALEQSIGSPVDMVWHRDTELSGYDLVAIPGGFSYGDYLRCGAMAARSPIMAEVVKHAERGGHVLGVCNGFQILCESGLLPGVLMRNANLKFICKDVALKVERADTPFTNGYSQGQIITYPVAHHDGNYFADDETLKRIEGEGQVALRYVKNPNGSRNDIAGVFNAKGNVLGMMPHPERLVDPLQGGIDGKPLFDALVKHLAA
ncbi:MAG: phosphoribosylformylglycinamidine synthase subunit PurQ [Alphaproteobacteria bacterium]|nr:phosphoribosylformylglycinamidine synthase subunit PurQ [Alphaproteobacteria bacterium]MBF0249590.1 phosphoribosylformylglycinamidine synthase subunit PurQ [Alphaproteobacteria bacterium]